MQNSCRRTSPPCPRLINACQCRGLLAACRSQIPGRDYQPKSVVVAVITSAPQGQSWMHGGPLVRVGGGTPCMPLVTLHVCRTLLLQNICQRRQVGRCSVLPAEGSSRREQLITSCLLPPLLHQLPINRARPNLPPTTLAGFCPSVAPQMLPEKAPGRIGNAFHDI